MNFWTTVNLYQILFGNIFLLKYNTLLIKNVSGTIIGEKIILSCRYFINLQVNGFLGAEFKV